MSKRLQPTHHDNDQFIRLLKAFVRSVTVAEKAWAFVVTLPRKRIPPGSRWVRYDVDDPRVWCILS